MKSGRRVVVYGPAYLDRVLLVDRALARPGRPPLDQSVDGSIAFGAGLVFRDAGGAELTVEPPKDWPGPTGTVRLGRRLEDAEGLWPLSVRGLSWHDDLGGMGAGFAAALDGDLVSAVGPENDTLSRAVAELLHQAGVRHRPVRVSGKSADWTLLLTSGQYGDKLPVGFRGCHASLGSLTGALDEEPPCAVRVVASLPNRLAAQALRSPGASVRVFAPAMRNMTDRNEPVGRFGGSIDVLCCNRREWESLDDREQVGWQVSILAVTDGPAGSVIQFTTPEGEPGRIDVPAFPRLSPPRDTNRAGEAFASTLLETLLDAGWSPGVSDPALVRRAAERASAAAALVLDHARFGFPTGDEIDAVLRQGVVTPSGRVGVDDPRYNAPGEPGVP